VKMIVLSINNSFSHRVTINRLFIDMQK